MGQEYWRKRRVKDFINYINFAEDFLEKSLEKIYRGVKKEVKKELSNLEINDSSLKEKLNKLEIRKLGMKEINDKIVGSATKLELIELQLQVILEKVYIAEKNNLEKYLYEAYQEIYEKSFFEINKELSSVLPFLPPNDLAISNAIKSKWSGEDFSERIWGRQKITFEKMKEAIITGITQGKSIDNIVKELKKRIQVSKNNAKRLARTESNYIYNKATLDAYKQSKIVKQYEYLACLDHRTSKICSSLNGQIFNIDEAMVGFNYPPMHPNCRSTTVAVF